jgi:L-alanine-DL-glutamate epimerase-like enolase superfamily enzyme
MEIDIDDVPWKDEMVTNPPEIIDGYMTIPSGPGWGVEIVEEVLHAHPVG